MRQTALIAKKQDPAKALDQADKVKERYMFETVTRIIAEQMDVDPASITEETSLVDDLKADSIDAAEMIINIESELDLRIPDEAIMNVRTVGDILTYLRQQMGQ